MHTVVGLLELGLVRKVRHDDGSDNFCLVSRIKQEEDIVRWKTEHRSRTQKRERERERENL